MGESSTSGSVAKKTPKKRSVIERCLVWAGILLLLGVVLVEWTSQRNFNSTLEAIESAIQASHSGKDAKPFLLTDLDQHVRGFPSRTDIKTRDSGQRTLQWPSLFKFYKLNIAYDERGHVFVVETLAADPVTEQKRSVTKS